MHKIKEKKLQIKENFEEKSIMFKAEIREKVNKKKEYLETQKNKINVLKNNIVQKVYQFVKYFFLKL